MDKAKTIQLPAAEALLSSNVSEFTIIWVGFFFCGCIEHNHWHRMITPSFLCGKLENNRFKGPQAVGEAVGIAVALLPSGGQWRDAANFGRIALAGQAVVGAENALV